MSVFLVTFLLVRSDRVVDESLYAALGEVLLQAVTLSTEDGEEVVYVVLRNYMAW